MRVVFAAIPAYGHLYPLMPLALACAEAGHDVVVATGEPFLERLPLPTWPSHPVENGIDWAFAETARRHPELEGYEVAIAMFSDVTAGMVAERLLTGLPGLAPDLVVFEVMNSGAGIAADILGIPAVAFSIGLWGAVPAVIHGAAVRYQSDLWARQGRTPPERPVLARALVEPTPPSLRRTGDLPDDQVLSIRSVAYSESVGVVPGWLAAPRSRPRVYVTLGTVSFGAVDVLRRAVTDLASLDVDVLVAVGPDGDPAVLGPVGERVHVETFVSQAEVLPLVDVVVHHGGTGTVLGTLAAGLPQLLLPQGADQFYNASLLPEVGAGRALRNDEQQPGAIAAVVAAMLESGSEREVACRAAAEIAALPAPADLVPELVRLAGA